MSDKALLELAAKAADYAIDFDDALDFGGSSRYFNYENGDFWNPLADDGDALRLAVKLGIVPCVVQIKRYVIATVHDTGKSCREDFREAEADPCAATRRAIVRAAAEIGKSLSISPSEGAKRGMERCTTRSS